MKTKILFILLLFSFSVKGFGQHPTAVADQINKMMPKPVHKAPNVAGIEKYGNYDVNLYNGLPSISIPIFEVQSGNLKIPITLSYHAGGFKYTDQASWVGMGWSLIAGGQISRTMEGKPDEGNGNFLSQTNNYNIQITPQCSDVLYKKDSYISNIDREADLFSYSIPGKSGSFYLRQGGQSPYIFPEAAIKITYQTALQFFDITDEDGVRYRFGKNTQNQDALDYTSSSFNHTTAWHLMEIHSPDSDDLISISYQPIGTAVTSDIAHNLTVVDDCFTEDPQYQPCPTLNLMITQANTSSSTTQMGINEITFETGKVKFVKGPLRTDLANTFSLDRVEIYRKEGVSFVLVKTFKMVNNDYFGGGGSRLKLNAMEVYDGSGTFINKYQFSYHTNTFSWDLPNSSYRRDWFGFYNNGKYTNDINQLVHNVNLIPRTTIPYRPVPTGPIEYLTVGGAGREPDTTYLKEAVLRRITFPTGGYTEFDFEPHQYQESGTTKYGGGLRVKRIKSVTGTQTNFKEYKYGTNESGNGWKNFDIRSFAFVNDNIFRQENIVGPPLNQYFAFKQFRSRMFFSSSAIGQFFQDSPVVYTLVAEYQNGSAANGKTVYEFDNNFHIGDGTFSVPYSNKTFWNSMSWARGKLTKKSIFNSSNQIVSQTDIGYTLLKSQNDHVSQGIIEYIVGDCYNCSAFIMMACSIGPDFYDGFKWHAWNFQKTTGLYKESSRTETLFSTGLSNHVTTSLKTYNPSFLQLTQEENRVSTNPESVVTRYRYPFDLVNTTTTYTNQPQILKQLLVNNQVSQPIEQYNLTQNVDGSNQKILSGQIIQFSTLPGNTSKIKPSEAYFLETSSPLATTLYSLYALSGTSATTMDSRYKLRLSFNSYDAGGNLLQVTKANDSPESYIWGYGGVYPVAQAKNATPSQLAYTSFESTEKGGWVYSGTGFLVAAGAAKTGRFVYNLTSGAVSRTTDASTTNKYKLSFWAKTEIGSQSWTVGGLPESLTTSWKLVEREVTSPNVSLSGSNILIDELRIHPINSQMTTTTFFPMLGIATQMDAKNHGTYYFYDPFGRLETIKNENGHVVEHYEYSYKK
ncbi:hypothetical protein [Cognataquiflexum aquatile]|uniref:hypothetical protein n=1 Tax=Cognataquiflexum aquatile TaxID=2249427 RepID=UPI0013006309|nr:hypothetical protein [Cognataquiflexum aquatile]